MDCAARPWRPAAGEAARHDAPRQPSHGYWVGIGVSNLRPKDCCASVIRSCPRRVARGADLPSRRDPRRGTLSAGISLPGGGEQAECRKT
jgi:hypothetical protein